MLKQPHNRPFLITAALCWLGWLFDFYDLILIAFLIPAIETTLHIDKSMGAWLLGVGLGASGLGGILFGWLADIYGRKTLLTITVLLFSVGMFLTAFTQTPWQFIIARFITGVGLGGEWALGHALIAESVPTETRARWGAFLQSGEPVGVALAAFMGLLVAPYLGWRIVILLSSLSGILAVFFRRYMQESPVWLHIRTHSPYKWLNQFATFFKNYKLLLFVALVLCILKIGTYWTCYTWLPRFISETYGQAIGSSLLWILCGQLGQFLGIFLYGYMAIQLGQRFSFSLFSLLTAITLFCLATYWNVLFQHYTTLFWLLIFLLGLGSGCVGGLGVLLAQLFPTTQRTFAMSLVFSLGRCLQLFSPVIVGYAVQGYGLYGGLMIPTLLAFITVFWVFTLPDRSAAKLDDVYLVED